MITFMDMETKPQIIKQPVPKDTQLLSDGDRLKSWHHIYLYYCTCHCEFIYMTVITLNCELLEGEDYIIFNSKATVTSLK